MAETERLKPMFSKEGLKLLHQETHETLDLVIEHAAKIPSPLFTREIEGFGRASVRNQLCHILSTESAWVCGLQGSPILRIDNDQIVDVPQLRLAKQSVMAQTVRYIDSLSVEELNTEVAHLPEQWIGPSRTPAFILLHVITHAFHHKGQVASMFRLIGHPIGDTDLQREG